MRIDIRVSFKKLLKKYCQNAVRIVASVPAHEITGVFVWQISAWCNAD